MTTFPTTTRPNPFASRPAVTRCTFALLIVLSSFVSLLKVAQADDPPSAEPLTRIAFGSCAHQDRPQPIWNAVLKADPQLWIWLGDTIYGDTADGAILAAKYNTLRAIPGYAELRDQAEIIGTWDDHDFGKNNGGKEFEGKEVAQSALLNFLGTPADSPRRQQEGVYWRHTYGREDRAVDVFLLDVRYHRDDRSIPNGSILGPAQRRWLQEGLAASKAPLILIASGIQVIPEDHKHEKWADFPGARQWLLDQVKLAPNAQVIFLSGDRHISELSKVQPGGHDRPLYDLTASSLTHAWSTFKGEPNRHRVGEVVTQNNFGLIEIDWTARAATFSIRDEANKVVLMYDVPLP